MPRDPDETPREFAARLTREIPASDADPASAIADLTDAYEHARYGAAPATPALVARARQALETIMQALTFQRRRE